MLLSAIIKVMLVILESKRRLRVVLLLFRYLKSLLRIVFVSQISSGRSLQHYISHAGVSHPISHALQEITTPTLREAWFSPFLWFNWCFLCSATPLPSCYGFWNLHPPFYSHLPASTNTRPFQFLSWSISLCFSGFPVPTLPLDSKFALFTVHLTFACLATSALSDVFKYCFCSLWFWLGLLTVFVCRIKVPNCQI